MKFKYRLLRLVGIFFLGYLLLFAACFASEYASWMPTSSSSYNHQLSESALGNAVSKKNYATTSYKAPQQQSPSAVAEMKQKYEQRGNIAATSSEFGDDVKKTREIIATHSGLVQLEKAAGTKGNRSIVISIGVTPIEFDPIYKELQSVGTLRVTDSNKIDKTNEFLTLKAKKISLEKNLTGLAALKSQQGTIPHFIQLQERILEIEQQLQSLGVDLGEFDELNSFCTVDFTLSEIRQSAKQATPFLYLIEEAVFLSAGLYIAFVATVFFVALTAFILLLCIDKFRLLQKLWETLERK